MTRQEWQTATQERIDDAAAALAAGRWSWAYYTSGYIVECALKSCVAALVLRDPGVVFRVRKFSDQCFSHDFKGLSAAAGLETIRDIRIAADPMFKSNWGLVCRWSETSRYGRYDEASAREMLEAIMNTQYGVLSWLVQHW